MNTTRPTYMPFPIETLTLLEHWIMERERIRVQHAKALPRPWTTDPVLARYRFCNVVRMDDRVSRWLFDRWYARTAPPATLLVQATIGRLINEPATLAHVTPPRAPYSTTDVRNLERFLLDRMAATAGPVYTSAYLVIGSDFAGDKGGKAAGIPRIVGRVSEAAHAIVQGSPTMEDMHGRLMRINGLGSFLAGQIVADMRHLLPDACSPDRYTWAPIGPGSRRGMNRLMGVDKDTSLTQAEFLPLLRVLRDLLRVPPALKRRIEAMDLQNCLCEFDKYCRAVHDNHRPRRLYPATPKATP
jgi:hypothetical protein